MAPNCSRWTSTATATSSMPCPKTLSCCRPSPPTRQALRADGHENSRPCVPARVAQWNSYVLTAAARRWTSRCCPHRAPPAPATSSAPSSSRPSSSAASSSSPGRRPRPHALPVHKKISTFRIVPSAQPLLSNVRGQSSGLPLSALFDSFTRQCESASRSANPLSHTRPPRQWSRPGRPRRPRRRHVRPDGPVPLRRQGVRRGAPRAARLASTAEERAPGRAGQASPNMPTQSPGALKSRAAAVADAARQNRADLSIPFIKI